MQNTSRRFLAPVPPLEPAASGRFWDETVRLLGLFEKYREAGDNSNATACFDRLAQVRYHELSQRPQFDRSLPSIVSVFQPKSGGTFLHNRLQQLGSQDYWWFFPDRLCHSVCYASDEALRLYVAGGCTCHTHARPDPNILAALDRAGVERIWVHLRNPAECAVSAFYHYRGEGHGAGTIGEQRRNEAIASAPKQGVTPEAELSAYVRDSLDWHIQWTIQWLRFAHSRPGLVEFSFYAELADPQAMLGRVFDALDVPLRGAVSAEPIGQDRIRTRGKADWRADLSPRVRKYVEQRVIAELQEFPEFRSLWT